MLKSISDFVKLMEDYLENRSLFSWASPFKGYSLSEDADRLHYVISSIQASIRNASLDFKFQVIAKLDELLITKKRLVNPDISARISNFSINLGITLYQQRPVASKRIILG